MIQGREVPLDNLRLLSAQISEVGDEELCTGTAAWKTMRLVSRRGELWRTQSLRYTA